MNERFLIKREDIEREARPCTADATIVTHAIEEAQNIDIRPRIGDAFFVRLFDETDKEAQAALEGGTYTDDCGNTRIYAGIRKALAYYAYGRIVRAGSGVQTRYGYVEKYGDNSQVADRADRVSAYQEAFAIADHYLAETMQYIASGACCGGVGIRNNRNTITIIGE